MRLAVVALLLFASPALACDAHVHDCARRSATSLNVPQGTFARARVVGRRPRGCPRRHCGCSLSLRIFGKIIPRLNLAANWLAFPRTSPAPGMVAARRGHVFQLIRHVKGKHWLAYDPNSGGGLTRIHVRSLAGFVIVNPKASLLARLR